MCIHMYCISIHLVVDHMFYTHMYSMYVYICIIYVYIIHLYICITHLFILLSMICLLYNVLYINVQCVYMCITHLFILLSITCSSTNATHRCPQMFILFIFSDCSIINICFYVYVLRTSASIVVLALTWFPCPFSATHVPVHRYLSIYTCTGSIITRLMWLVHQQPLQCSFTALQS